MPDTLARRLIVGLSGAELTAQEVAWLAHYHPAGVILYSRNCKNYNQLRKLCSMLRELVPGLEIMADHEGGPISQLARAVGRPPAAWALGALDDPALTARVHAETGRRLRAVGVTRVLAPVADVLTAGRNPVIGARAFGGDERRVERHTVAAVTGLLSAGLKVCLKHWPGHGGSLVDSHLSAAAAGSGAVSMPFVAGLTAGADAVMVGHLDSDSDAGDGLPATMDAEFLARSVRQLAQASDCSPQLIADDVTMGGLRPAMGDLGLAPDDGSVAGMVEPAALPRDWLAAVADAGCDRLLVRGLPVGAFPLPESPWSVGPVATEDTHAAPEFDDAIYAQVRQRSWAPAAVDFADPDADLLWWDFTALDRWQVAGGDLGTAREQLLPVLTAHFSRVVHGTDSGRQRGGVARLLVTSHRPLPDLGDRDPSLALAGVCLVMGHPSLAADLAGYLGAGWQVGAVYDLSAADLFPASSNA